MRAAISILTLMVGASVLAGCAGKPSTAAEPAPPAAKPLAPATAPAGTAISIGRYVSGAPRLTSLARALTASGMAGTLAQRGPFTLFAPSDAAFQRLPAGSLARLMQPAEQSRLVRLVAHHVVAGDLSSEALRQRVAAGGGYARFTTMAGETLSVSVHSGKLLIQDDAGDLGYVIGPDQRVANGRVHIVNGVMLTKPL